MRRGLLVVALVVLLPATLNVSSVNAGTTVQAVSARLETVVACLNNAGNVVARVKPSSCLFFKAGEPDVGDYYADMSGLRWTHWGAAAATATGTLHGNMDFQTTATLHFSRLIVCQARNEVSYTHMASNIPSIGPVSMALQSCP